MPELPEVEVVRRGLAAHVVGRTITGASVHHPRAVRRHEPGPADFVARLAGRPVLDAVRRGKYLWLPLGPALATDLADLAAAEPAAQRPAADGPQTDDAVPVDVSAEPDEAIVAHLGMSGQMLVQDADAPLQAHLRIRLNFADDGPELRFVDQRTFGGLAVEPLVADGVPRSVAHIARDVLDPAFDDAAFAASLRRRHTGVKRALLDQTLVSGIGNIYADEALWRARLHYARPTETLRRPEVDRLLAGVREVMAAALAAGGTSFDSLYVNVNGDSGYFDRSLHVYGRAGSPCDRCGTQIRRDAFMNRSSFFCARCQPVPRRARY